MDPDEIFKRFFGMSFPEIGHPKFSPLDEGGSRGSGCGKHHHHGGDMFSDLHIRIQEQMEEMDKQMQETFRFFTNIPDQLPATGSEDRTGGSGYSARDQMLKDSERGPSPPQSRQQPSQDTARGPTTPPHSFPFSGGAFSPWFERFMGMPPLNSIPSPERRDKDIDGESPSKEDIVDIYQRTQEPAGKEDSVDIFRQTQEPSGWSMGSGRSINMQTVVAADGTVEERVHVRDSSGREETTVRRRVGDKSHTITTITDDKGHEEKREIFENIEKDKLGEFDKHWRGKGQSENGSLSTPSHGQDFTPRGGMLSDDRGFFRKLFGF